MASENESTKLPFNGETGNVRNKVRRNGKVPNKTPQRGVGIEKLEKMRIQESLKPFHQQQLLFTSYGGAFHHFPQQQQQVMMINNNNNNINNVVCSGFSGSCFSPFVGSASSSSSSSNGFGWIFRNPFENSSKELSSIPNLNHHQSLDLCLKKTRLNEENIMMRGTNSKREMPLEIWNKHHPVHHNFLGIMPQASVSAYPNQNLDEKTRLNEENVMMRGTNARREMNHHNFPIGFMPQPSVSAYPTQNHDECMEVVAVHRKRDSSLRSGKVFMEYEFFPKKDGKSNTTTSTIGSGEASSSITVTSYGDTSTAYDSVDLSLRL